MTKEERELLLTIARLFRARLKTAVRATNNSFDQEDYDAVAHALKPFDPVYQEPINEASK